MFNLTLAVRTRAEIEESVATAADTKALGWNQNYWAEASGDDLIVDPATGLPMGTGSCNTGMCFAGWALTLSNVKLDWRPAGHDGNGVAKFIADDTIDGVSVMEAASDRLGLVMDELEESGDRTWDGPEGMPRLYSPHNDLEDLYYQVSLLSDVPVDDLKRMVGTERARLLAPLAKGVSLNTPA